MRNKIAIVGSGISGLSAAYALRETADVTLFEADSRLGGHSNTVDVDLGDWSGPVDTGFIVFNHVNYPNLVRLFDELGVKTKLSDIACQGMHKAVIIINQQNHDDIFSSPRVSASVPMAVISPRALSSVSRYSASG